MPLRNITLLAMVAYLDVQTIYRVVRSPVLKDYLTVELASCSHETPEDNTFGLLPVSDRRLGLLHYAVGATLYLPPRRLLFRSTKPDSNLVSPRIREARATAR